MGRKRRWPPPVYVRRGMAIMRVWIGPGKYKDITLGPAGSQEAEAAYASKLHDLKNPAIIDVENIGRHARFGRLPRKKNLTVDRLAEAYAEHMRPQVCKKQHARIVRALRPCAGLVADFDSGALEKVQESYLAAGLVKRYANQLTGIVRQAFRWGASKRLVPQSVLDSIATVAPIRKGKPSTKVRPPNLEAVDATLKELQPIPADLVRLILYTGMRAGEACIIRPCDVNREGIDPDGQHFPGCWVYVPESHKNAHRGQPLVYFLGERAQAVLAPYLLRPADAYCFSPREAVERFQSGRGQKFNATAKRAPRDRYCAESLGCCIRRAIARAKAGSWHLHQLRHGVSTAARTKFGPEHARAALGHASMAAAMIYAESDREKAAEVMRRIG